MATDTARAITNLRSLTQRFDMGMEAATPFYPNIATIIQSEGADEEYGGMGAVPGIREWVGDRIFNKLRGAKFTLANKKWESSVEIEKDDIDDARLLKYGPVLEEMGKEAAMHPDELAFDVLIAGDAQVCFDGQYFFDTDHIWGDSGTQSNDLTSAAASGTTPTADEFRTAYHAARAAMLGFKKDNGKLWHRPTIGPISDLVVLVKPAHQEVAVTGLTAQLVGGGNTNIVLDRPQIIACPYITADVFYLLRVGQPLKPLVFQARQPVQRQMKGMDDREFKDVKFMTDARYNLGYLAWWNAVLTTWT